MPAANGRYRAVFGAHQETELRPVDNEVAICEDRIPARGTAKKRSQEVSHDDSCVLLLMRLTSRVMM